MADSAIGNKASLCQRHGIQQKMLLLNKTKYIIGGKLCVTITNFACDIEYTLRCPNEFPPSQEMCLISDLESV